MSTLQDQSANAIARRLLLAEIFRYVSFIALLPLVALGTLLPPSPWRDGVLIGLAVTPALAICSQRVAYLFWKQKVGTTLLNIGYQDKVSGWQITAGVILSILLFITVPYDFALAVFRFGAGTYFLAATMSKFIAGREPTLVTEKGFYSPNNVIQWDRIESRQWLNQHEYALLILKLKNRPWPLDEKTMRVPDPFKADVDKILREKGIA